MGVQDGESVVVGAPHTGTDDVCAEPFPDTVGTMWGNIGYVGASDPSR